MARKNIIDEKGLGDQVLALHFEDRSERDIAKQLGIGPDSVHRWLNTHKTAKQVAATAEIVPVFPGKGKILVEVTQEMAKNKLGQLVGEAERKYNEFSEEGEKKDDQKAAYWFGQYQLAVEKLLKASGQYEKARRMAEQEEVPKIVFEVLPPVKECHHCGKSL